jgi:NitT/TauT family transport system substrate-binding protein
MKNYFLLLSLIVLSSCNESNKKSNLVDVKLQLDWFLNSTFCGEILAAEKFDNISGINLKYFEATEGIDPIKAVLSGSSDIGIVSADKYLAALEKGAPLKLIAIKNPLSPTVFISLKKKNINTLSDFKNKRVGVLPGGSTLYIYEALIKQSGLTKSDFVELQIPFDLSTFILDKYDVRPAFAYDEPVSLELKKIEYNVIKPSDYKINFVGGVYFTTEKYFNSNIETVNKIVEILQLSWDWVFKNRNEAIKILKKVEKSIDEEREINSLELMEPYFVYENSYIPTETKILNNTLDQLILIGEIKNKFDIK